MTIRRQVRSTGARWITAPSLALVLLATDAHAHVRSVSWSSWSVVGATVEARVRMSALDLTAVGDPQLALRGLELRPCTRTLAQEEPSEPGYVAYRLRFACPEGATPQVESATFMRQIPSHVHFAQLSRDGAVVGEQLLSRARTTWVLPPAPRGMPAFDLVALGVRHILSGADHLVFLGSLAMAATTLRGLVGAVSGFTLGHTLALALAALAGVRPPEATVEALVGLTILVVGVENVWRARRDPWLPGARRDPWLPRALLLALACALPLLGAQLGAGLWLLIACSLGLAARAGRWASALGGARTATFGLIHGFAFSTALLELALPRARLSGAVVAFNAGVELGQLAVLALAWPAVRWLGRTRHRHVAMEIASAAAVGAGVYWFVSRAAADGFVATLAARLR